MTDEVTLLELLVVLVSPPPDIVAVLVIEAGALFAILTLTVTKDADEPDEITLFETQLTVVAVDEAQSQPEPLAIAFIVNPDGITSVIV